jgi:DNA ligase-1
MVECLTSFERRAFHWIWKEGDMQRFAETASAISARSGRLDKIAVLAEYLRELDDGDLEAVSHFFSGRALPARDSRSLSLGGRGIVKVARRLWGFDDATLTAAYRATGDLGDALAELVRHPREPTLLPVETLTPARLAELFDEIAEAAGKNAAARREALLERILRALQTPQSVAYVVKIVTGELRAGLRESLVLEAIAAAFGATPDAVRRAAMAGGDVGAAALAAKRGQLDQLQVAYGVAIGFMLASPIAHAPSYKVLASQHWVLEDKYDGIRAQAHVTNSGVRLFSRTLNDVARVACAARDSRRRDRGNARRAGAAVSRFAVAATPQADRRAVAARHSARVRGVRPAGDRRRIAARSPVRRAPRTTGRPARRLGCGARAFRAGR